MACGYYYILNQHTDISKEQAV